MILCLLLDLSVAETLLSPPDLGHVGSSSHLIPKPTGKQSHYETFLII